jgi:hypothetical protein
LHIARAVQICHQRHNSSRHDVGWIRDVTSAGDIGWLKIRRRPRRSIGHMVLTVRPGLFGPFDPRTKGQLLGSATSLLLFLDSHDPVNEWTPITFAIVSPGLWGSRILDYDFGTCGFGIRSVHEAPNAIVRPCGRASARNSGSYLKNRFTPFAGRMKLVWNPMACTE